MADVASDIKDWSVTASSNSPADATAISAGLADNFQQVQATVRAAFAHKGSDIASAGSMDLGAVTGYYHDITGSTGPITSFGTVSAGVSKILQFDSTPTITYNATSMILPGNVDYTAAAGDHLYAMSLGSGNWIVLWIVKDAAGVAPPFSDAVGIVRGSADATKILRFEVDGFTAGNTRVITPPDANLTIPAVTAKGDLVAASGSGVLVRVAVSATDGDVLIADSSAAGGVSYRTKVTRATAEATTTGTTITFSSIPSWVKRIEVVLSGVSTGGTSNFLIQIGDAGDFETSSYESSSELAGTGASSTAGFIFSTNGAAALHHGIVTLINVSGNLWVASGVVRPAGTATSGTCAGSKTLSATLDRLRLTTVSGDTFDAGSMTILYE